MTIGASRTPYTKRIPKFDYTNNNEKKECLFVIFLVRFHHQVQRWKSTEWVLVIFWVKLCLRISRWLQSVCVCIVRCVRVQQNIMGDDFRLWPEKATRDEYLSVRSKFKITTRNPERHRRITVTLYATLDTMRMPSFLHDNRTLKRIALARFLCFTIMPDTWTHKYLSSFRRRRNERIIFKYTYTERTLNARTLCVYALTCMSCMRSGLVCNKTVWHLKSTYYLCDRPVSPPTPLKNHHRRLSLRFPWQLDMVRSHRSAHPLDIASEHRNVKIIIE